MLELISPGQVALDLANRIRDRRLKRNWTQAELAERAGIKQPTYVLFEKTGRISLARLLKILGVLDLLPEFDRIGRNEDLAGMTLDDLDPPKRKRARRSRLRS